MKYQRSSSYKVIANAKVCCMHTHSNQKQYALWDFNTWGIKKMNKVNAYQFCESINELRPHAGIYPLQ